MIYNVTFAEKAEETVEEIKGQILSRWNKEQVIIFEKRVKEVIGSISLSPFIYKSIPQFPNVRKAFIHRNCAMFYKVHENLIIILFFIDNRQEPIF